MVKKLPEMRESWIWPLGWEDPLEEGITTHSSILAWKIPGTEEPGGLQSMKSQRVRHDRVTEYAFMYFILANHFLYKTISFNPNQNTHTHTHTHTHTYLKNQYGRLLYFPFMQRVMNTKIYILKINQNYLNWNSVLLFTWCCFNIQNN